MAVVHNGVIVSHLLRKISLICSLFINRGGSYYCVGSCRQRHRTDLLQGTLVVPCMVTFTGSSESMKKLKLKKLTTINVEIFVED